MSEAAVSWLTIIISAQFGLLIAMGVALVQVWSDISSIRNQIAFIGAEEDFRAGRICRDIAKRGEE